MPDEKGWTGGGDAVAHSVTAPNQITRLYDVLLLLF